VNTDDDVHPASAPDRGYAVTLVARTSPDFAVYGTAPQGRDVTELADGFLTALGHPAPATSGVATADASA
jgi:hypothetical protein